ncbi:lytic transglycosylase domain-containing protein [Roseobacter weihaiensis]|uniref:lytic transglycosylase domain-containing protein n=1 Tax=Roseobacter weihaiensis TaxID=2763262 RepID=UPI001D0ACD9A|nr:lytic transglycosylase domain-containing protein [Roseobacter sp. H9]
MRIQATASLIAAILLCAPIEAETPNPYPDFSAKRVSVPKPGERPTIAQIDPEEQARLLAGLPRPSPLPDTIVPDDTNIEEGKIGVFSWFWSKVSPALVDSGPGRLDKAMTVLAGTGGIPQPRLQHLQQIARANGVDILRSTVGTRVSPALVLAVISVESAGNPEAVSSAGAQGLMQLMPATAARFGVEDSLSPQENIGGGVQYLNWLMEEFDGDPIMVLAGYNAGEGSLRKHQGVPPFAETRDYVPKVLAAFQIARGLCLTPPELVSDGCVFAGLN